MFGYYPVLSRVSCFFSCLFNLFFVKIFKNFPNFRFDKILHFSHGWWYTLFTKDNVQRKFSLSTNSGSENSPITWLILIFRLTNQLPKLVNGFDAWTGVKTGPYFGTFLSQLENCDFAKFSKIFNLHASHKSSKWTKF